MPPSRFPSLHLEASVSVPSLHRRKLIQRLLDRMHKPRVNRRLRSIPQRNTSKAGIFSHIGNDFGRRRASHVPARRCNLCARRKRQEHLEILVARFALDPRIPLAKVEARVHACATRYLWPHAGCARGVVIELNEHCIKLDLDECCGEVQVREHALRGCSEEVFFASVPTRELAQATRKVLVILRGRQLDVEVKPVDHGVAERPAGGLAAAEGIPDLVCGGICSRLVFELRIAADAAADRNEDLLAKFLAGFDVGTVLSRASIELDGAIVECVQQGLYPIAGQFRSLVPGNTLSPPIFAKLTSSWPPSPFKAVTKATEMS